jgi:hypothetical protein
MWNATIVAQIAERMPTFREKASEHFLAKAQMFRIALSLVKVAHVVYMLPPFRSGVVRRTGLSGTKKEWG